MIWNEKIKTIDENDIWIYSVNPDQFWIYSNFSNRDGIDRETEREN